MRKFANAFALAFQFQQQLRKQIATGQFQSLWIGHGAVEIEASHHWRGPGQRDQRLGEPAVELIQPVQQDRAEA